MTYKKHTLFEMIPNFILKTDFDKTVGFSSSIDCHLKKNVL